MLLEHGLSRETSGLYLGGNRQTDNRQGRRARGLVGYGALSTVSSRKIKIKIGAVHGEVQEIMQGAAKADHLKEEGLPNGFLPPSVPPRVEVRL